jgi:Raf kinase inhibitor-like YbhB/YbcL family protein
VPPPFGPHVQPVVKPVLALGLALGLAIGLAACDTGDGKALRPIDPDSTTTSTIGTSTLATSTVVPAVDAAGSIETGLLPSVPLDEPLATDAADPAQSAAFELFTPWTDGATIDTRYTCDGDDVSPPLSWKSPPDGTVQLAFAMVDESTFDDEEPFVHWVVAGVEPDEISLLEDDVPAGAVQAENSFGVLGWSGPCPPEDEPPHEYRLTMYALNQQVELADETPANELLDYIRSIAMASADVTATYQR